MGWTDWVLTICLLQSPLLLSSGTPSTCVMGTPSQLCLCVTCGHEHGDGV